MGKTPANWVKRNGEKMLRAGLDPWSFRLVLYDHLIQNAEKSHKEYMERRKEVSRIYDLVTTVDPEDRDMLS